MLFIALATSVMSCNEEIKLSFVEENILQNDNAIVEINIPRAEGEDLVSKLINAKIDNHIANILNFSEDQSETLTRDEAIQKFQTAFSEFKLNIDENAMPWEATFDGDVIFHSSEIICIAVNAYTNTGGAHGNMNITLFNFNAQNGTLLKMEEFISDINAFTAIVKTHFEKEIQSESDASMVDYFFGEEFHLPANIGFNDEGVLILYNVYEIATYADGITEFTIPFEELTSVLTRY